ncbi:putative flagellar protein FhlB cytoplasmic domain protein [Methylophaga frappieri]|uniref:Putative flagellar protein FhlB cytoplasmic domain protein n=2 Tax=Methylophaga frappieri (strain ATCC BAA-2434 / DSM 25690 / JAM7) TaxID=754477 RepID=I1YHN2_METFJ|nr:putative flagellar protein FhlB cytoplasmic domain protein [Methylophaga frappieri]
MAEEIIRIAREHNIPLHQDSGLTALLKDLELGESVPPVLYQVIAEVLAYAYWVSGKVPERQSKNANSAHDEI